MTLFEIIASIGIFGIILCLGLVIWVLRQLISKPKKQARTQAKQLVETEIKQAKSELNLYKAKTRINPKVEISDMKINLEKLKNLRRSK